MSCGVLQAHSRKSVWWFLVCMHVCVQKMFPAANGRCMASKAEGCHAAKSR